MCSWRNGGAGACIVYRVLEQKSSDSERTGILQQADSRNLKERIDSKIIKVMMHVSNL